MLRDLERALAQTIGILLVVAVLFAFARAADLPIVGTGLAIGILSGLALWAVGRFAWGRRSAAQTERKKPRRRALPPPPRGDQ